jgi:drug/metabolite transporter (DMT)-like permease
MSFSMMMFLGVFCSVIAFLLYNRGLKTMAASTVTSMLNLVPIFGVFFSWLLLGEQVSLRKFVGGAIVIFGVMLSVRNKKAETLQETREELTKEQTAEAVPNEKT